MRSSRPSNRPRDEALEVIGYVVGVGTSPELDQFVDYLADHDITINVVAFEVFELAPGDKVLIPAVTEGQPQPEAKPSVTMDDLQRLADNTGVGDELRIMREAAERNDIYPRLFKTSVMFAPPANKTRMLWTCWVKGDSDGMRMYPSAEAFAQFCPVNEEEAWGFLGPDGWRHVRTGEAEAIAHGLGFRSAKPIPSDATQSVWKLPGAARRGATIQPGNGGETGDVLQHAGDISNGCSVFIRRGQGVLGRSEPVRHARDRIAT